MPSRSTHSRRGRPAPAGELRDGFKFRGGRLALDLTASLAGRLRDEPRELLAAPRDLGRWLVAAGLTARDPGATAEDLAHARALREAIYGMATSRVRRRPLATAERTLVNRWAALPPPAPELAADGEVRWIGGGVSAMLTAIARDAVEVLGEPTAPRVRACSGSGCAVLFLDSSRAGRRRWCSMAACGNKAKVGDFRRRSRRSDAQPPLTARGSRQRRP